MTVCVVQNHTQNPLRSLAQGSMSMQWSPYTSKKRASSSIRKLLAAPVEDGCTLKKFIACTFCVKEWKGIIGGKILKILLQSTLFTCTDYYRFSVLHLCDCLSASSDPLRSGTHAIIVFIMLDLPTS